MHESREQKRDKRRRRLGQVEGADRRVVDVAKQEVVDGSVPVARVLVPRDAVPPVTVEAAVGEAGEFGENIEDAFLIVIVSTCALYVGECRGDLPR